LVRSAFGAPEAKPEVNMEDTRGQFRSLPMGTILDRYLLRAFLRIFFVSLLSVASIYLIVDFFDRVASFLGSGASIGVVARYFFYRAPLSISRVIGFATLFSTLFCLGMLARGQEITAMRSSGISVQRIALPLLLLSLFIGAGNFFWNETLVPVFSHRAQTIYITEVRNQQQQSLFGTSDIWIRGENAFINITKFDTNTNTLENVTVFRLNRDFSLRGLTEIPRMHWTGKTWEGGDTTEWDFAADGRINKQSGTVLPHFTETPEDLRLLARDPEEFTFFDLQKQIEDMRSKGLDATAYEVDLQTKLAIPVISPLMILLAVPFALKRRLGAGMALSFGVAMLIGFGYWVLTAFCISLGHSAALPPWVAGWVPNSIFALIGLYFFTAEE
jgi:lipopolysaccharide export system permease protein